VHLQFEAIREEIPQHYIDCGGILDRCFGARGDLEGIDVEPFWSAADLVGSDAPGAHYGPLQGDVVHRQSAVACLASAAAPPTDWSGFDRSYVELLRPDKRG
jgi:hypothetical protein